MSKNLIMKSPFTGCWKADLLMIVWLAAVPCLFIGGAGLASYVIDNGVITSTSQSIERY